MEYPWISYFFFSLSSSALQVLLTCLLPQTLSSLYSKMVSKKIVTAAAVATVGVNAQVDGIIKSIVTQISNGLVAGRKSGVEEAQASSEVAEIIAALNKNSDVQNLLTSAANVVLDGINSDGVINLVSGAKASLSAFEGSGDYQTVSSLIAAHITDLDASAGLASVSKNLAPVLNLVIPPISSLSAGDKNVASAIDMALTDAYALLGKFGLGPDAGAAAPTSAAGSASASATEASSSAQATAEGTASIITKAVSSSHAAGEAATHTGSAAATGVAAPSNTDVAQVNGQTALKGGVVAAGLVAAGALLI